jgi:hypothetical protein
MEPGNNADPPLHATQAAICLTESGKNLKEGGKAEDGRGNAEINRAFD